VVLTGFENSEVYVTFWNKY